MHTLIIIFIVAISIVILSIYIGFYRYTFGKAKAINIEKFIPKIKYEESIRIIKDGIKWFDNIEKDDIFTKSYDNIKLHAYFIRAESNDTIILFHGYHSCPQNDFSGIMKYYHEKGLNILLVDQRAHGMSDGKIITFGVKEKFDAVSWVKYVKEIMPGGKIYLGGISMGATTVMMASGLVDGISGIVADCGFTSPKEIITRVAKHKHIPLFIVNQVMFLAKKIGGFDCSETTLTSMEKSNVPVLFIHGRADKFVPYEMTERNYASCISEKRMVIVENATHGCSFIMDRKKIIYELENFIFN